MTFTREPLPNHLTVQSRIGDEISITGKWVPSKPGGRFRTTEESREMMQEWEDIHQGARADDGVLSTEINHAVGEDAVLVVAARSQGAWVRRRRICGSGASTPPCGSVAPCAVRPRVGVSRCWLQGRT